MKILALEQDVPGVTNEQFTPAILQAEAARAWELHLAGVIRELYLRADQHSAVLVLECPDVAAAQAVLNTLPLVEQHLITFEVIPLRVYPGFARLFATLESSSSENNG
ncbi:MAG TPA: muconolactone Delta-isomerase family protein [Phototrophicaceae bacterium]|nr:muconolactone Delta-isomerase family protein [Phototrophicaceae bacterium]